ncbi:MAG: hypothetical protein QJR14_06460 [Bacillota bacterium]|nr:hypothetical protein [Bacillota bacterium]
MRPDRRRKAMGVAAAVLAALTIGLPIAFASPPDPAWVCATLSTSTSPRTLQVGVGALTDYTGYLVTINPGGYQFTFLAPPYTTVLDIDQLQLPASGTVTAQTMDGAGGYSAGISVSYGPADGQYCNPTSGGGGGGSTGATLDDVVNAINSASQAIQTKLDQAHVSCADAITTASSGIQGAINSASSAIQGAISTASQAVQNAIGSLQAYLSSPNAAPPSEPSLPAAPSMPAPGAPTYQPQLTGQVSAPLPPPFPDPGSTPAPPGPPSIGDFQPLPGVQLDEPAAADQPDQPDQPMEPDQPAAPDPVQAPDAPMQADQPDQPDAPMPADAPAPADQPTAPDPAPAPDQPTQPEAPTQPSAPTQPEPPTAPEPPVSSQ